MGYFGIIQILGFFMSQNKTLLVDVFTRILIKYGPPIVQCMTKHFKVKNQNN